MTEKQFKIIVKKDKHPQLYKWVRTLPFGAFPKVIFEVLDWLDKEELLVKGGLTDPRLCLEKRKNVGESNDQSDLLLKRLDEIKQLLLERPTLTATELPVLKNQESVLMDGGGSSPTIENLTEDEAVTSNPTPFQTFKRKKA